MANEKVTSISKPRTIDVLMKGTAVIEQKTITTNNPPRKSIVESENQNVRLLKLYICLISDY